MNSIQIFVARFETSSLDSISEMGQKTRFFLVGLHGVLSTEYVSYFITVIKDTLAPPL
jgi:hypothetical protein